MNVDKMMKKIIPGIEEKILYSFKDKNILLNALTHSSFANNYKYLSLKNNERLEFLGDSVLSLIISHILFTKYDSFDEGQLSKIRAAVVCEQSLFKVATENNFGQYLLLGKGEEMTNGRERASILADMVEAIIGAIYMDGGFESAYSFVEGFISPMISGCENQLNCPAFIDYKTILQEKLQKKKSLIHIEYVVIKEVGPDHDKLFYVEVKVEDNKLGEGKGKSKKEAEQNAAKNALLGMNDQ